MNKSQKTLLLELLGQPTAPFREEHVVALVARTLKRRGIPYFEDDVGNLVVGVASPRGYRRLVGERSTEPIRLFIAHMDHPGFHGTRWAAPDRLAVKWHGGSPTRHLRGARVWLATGKGWAGTARITQVKLQRGGYGIDTGLIRVPPGLRSVRPRELFGGFGFRAPVWQTGKRIYTKAADDLVGVFAVLETATHVWRSRDNAHPVPFIGLLTRAEEVGFVGAVGHFELGWLHRARRPLLCISLEASRTLPGAVIGRGPVVRLGDRRTVFDPDALKVLTDLAEKHLRGRHQRRIMDGGACEATAATAWGLPAVGLSIPLGNYHNQGYEGGPDCTKAHGPAPEFVHIDDVTGILKLCRALMRPGLPWDKAWHCQRQRLLRNLARHQRLLER